MRMLVASGAPQPSGIAVSPDATACLLYTSGTTGAPKGAELTHRGLLLNCASAIAEMFQLTAADVTLAPMPFFHVGGMWYHLFPSFAAGCTTVIMPQFDPQGVLDADGAASRHQHASGPDHDPRAAGAAESRRRSISLRCA